MFILAVILAAEDTGLSSTGVAAVLSAAFAGMVALGGILFKEFARKDTRTDRISAEMVAEIKAQRDDAIALAKEKEREADEWERKCHVKEMELQIAQMNLRNMMGPNDG